MSNPADSPPKLLAILGPTAVGKTDLAVAIAERIGAEIISADSRQIYKRLNIGTAKPSIAELKRVPHHFINELDLGEPFSAGQFAGEANCRIDSILTRGRRPLVVGGSTLYIEALLHGLSDIPATTRATRAMLMSRLESEGAKALFEELEAVDPSSAATMDTTKTQRVVRALEVYHDTGNPLSWYHAHRAVPRFNFVPIVLNRPRKRLYNRINLRVDTMLEAGLIDENRRLRDAGIGAEHGPLKTIGYREPMAYLRGDIDYDDMVRRIKQNSRRYAKRQLTWFRRRPEYRWIEIEAQPSLGITIDTITELLSEYK